MKSDLVEHCEREKFYYRLRLIFTYHASQGDKEDPLVLREKSFHKFLTHSTIAQILKSHNKQKSGTKRQTLSSRTENKNLQIVVNTYHKPMHFEQFQSVITKILFETRNQKSSEDDFQEQEVQKDLFKLYQSDEIVSGIFSFLYEEIEQGTQFGSLIIFSQNKAFFNQKVWKQMENYHSILKYVYIHYFDSKVVKQRNSIQNIMSVIKKFCLDFEIAPLKLSMTQVFIIIWEIINSKAASVYETRTSRGLHLQDSLKMGKWQDFPYHFFVKLIIMTAFLIDQKQNIPNRSTDGPTTIRDFLEYIGTTKGFKNIKSIYKINGSFYAHDMERLSSSIQTKKKQEEEKVLHFQPKKYQISKEVEILESFDKFLQMIFMNYTSSKQTQKFSEGKMPKRQLDNFCSEFKVVPHLASKKQIGQIYQKIIFERDYFYLSYESFNHLQAKRILEENKIKIYDLVSNPSYGLKFEQFKKFFIYGCKLNKISEKLTAVERLIYWMEYMFSQQKTKGLMEKYRTREKFFVEKEINLLPIYQKSNQSRNFYNEHQSMYKKLKKTLK